MKKSITLCLALMCGIFMEASAQYNPIVAEDPKGDLAGGTSGIDVKNVSYKLSADKKHITFKFEMHDAVASWKDAGFILNFDDDNDPSKGDAPFGPNKAMKADRAIICMNNSMGWTVMLNTSNPMSSSSLTSSVAITTVDPKTLTIEIPVAKIDANADGKFNTIIEAAKGVMTSSTYDALPNTGYSSVDLAKPTNISEIGTTNSFAMYPNPATDVINFTTDNSVKGSIAISNLQGAILISTQLSGTTTTIPVKQLAAGVYTYQIVSENREVLKTGKVLIGQ